VIQPVIVFEHDDHPIILHSDARPAPADIIFMKVSCLVLVVTAIPPPRAVLNKHPPKLMNVRFSLSFLERKFKSTL